MEGNTYFPKFLWYFLKTSSSSFKGVVLKTLKKFKPI